MKIALVSQPFDDVLGPLPNSIGLIVAEIARRLARSHEVVVYGRYVAEQAQPSDWEYRPIRAPSDRYTARALRALARFFPRKRPYFAAALFHPEYGRRVARDLRHGGYDVVHVLNSSHYLPLVRAAAPRARAVLHMECEWLSQMDASLVRRRLGSADRIACCSNYIREQTTRAYPELADRCAVLPNGFDADLFTLPQPPRAAVEKRLLYVGRVTSEKGVHVLLDAFRRILDADVEALADAALALLRDGERRGEMDRAARQRAAELYTWDQVARQAEELYRA